jgi:FixJ family two-component response regulator
MEKNAISIIVVDDEKPIVDTMLVFLSRIGFQAKGFYDSEEAIKYLDSHSFDVMFTDLMMPKVSGMDLVKRIKERGDDTQIIIFTGYATTDSAIEAIQFGVYDYIRKPFKLDEIKVTLNRAVEKLLLKRENVFLNKRIEKMLADITMLYDISNIFYQIDNFADVAEMVLDTLSEGISIHHAAILKLNPDRRYYQVVSQRGLSEALRDAFLLSKNDSINDVSLDSDQSVVLSDQEKAFYLNGEKLPDCEHFDKIYFIPIKYQGVTEGYLAIFQERDNDTQIVDELKLYEILATQIAPVFVTAELSDDGGANDKSPLFNDIQTAILEMEKVSNSVTFILFRMTIQDKRIHLEDFKKARTQIKKLLNEEFSGNGKILSETWNYHLVAIPGANTISAQMSSNIVIEMFQESFEVEGGKSAFRLDYLTKQYPFDSDDIGELADIMVYELLQNPFPEF